MSDTERLLPCPFCGGEAEHKMYLWGHNTKSNEPIWRFYAYCMRCGAMTDNMFETKNKAIQAWNKRV